VRFPGRSRSLPAKQARSICGMHCLDSVVDENYEAYYGVQMRATSVGCVESPEWSVPCEQTERPPRGTDAKTG
jgi:hypothetical protein